MSFGRSNFEITLDAAGIPLYAVLTKTEQKVEFFKGEDEYVAPHFKASGAELDVHYEMDGTVHIYRIVKLRNGQSYTESYKPTDKSVKIIRQFKIKPRKSE